MKTQTKINRAKLVLGILEENIDEPKTLSCWLTLINDKLSSQYSLRSTKELAHMFRYMVYGMNVNLMKHKELVFLEKTKFNHTLYTFKNGIEQKV